MVTSHWTEISHILTQPAKDAGKCGQNLLHSQNGFKNPRTSRDGQSPASVLDWKLWQRLRPRMQGAQKVPEKEGKELWVILSTLYMGHLSSCLSWLRHTALPTNWTDAKLLLKPEENMAFYSYYPRILLSPSTAHAWLVAVPLQTFVGQIHEWIKPLRWREKNRNSVTSFIHSFIKYLCSSYSRHWAHSSDQSRQKGLFSRGQGLK